MGDNPDESEPIGGGGEVLVGGGEEPQGSGLPELVFANAENPVEPSLAIIHDNESFEVQWSAMNIGQADSEPFTDNLTIYQVPSCPGSDDDLTEVWSSDVDGDPSDFEQDAIPAGGQGSMMQPTVGPFPPGFYRLTVTLNSGFPPAPEQTSANNSTFHCIEVRPAT